jgi:hypothetical protein
MEWNALCQCLSQTSKKGWRLLWDLNIFSCGLCIFVFSALFISCFVELRFEMGKSGYRLGVIESFLSDHVYGHYSRPSPAAVITFGCFLCDSSFCNSGLWLHVSAVINVRSQGKDRRFQRKLIQFTQGRAVGVTTSKIRFLTSTMQYKFVIIFYFIQCVSIYNASYLSTFFLTTCFGRTWPSSGVSNSLKLLHCTASPASHVTCEYDIS